MVTVGAAPTLSLSNLTNGTNIADSVITITGSTQAPPNSAVTVNGIIGTIGYRFEAWSEDAPHTTPESDDIARLAGTMLARGASHLIMEVSSHALAQARVDAVHFRAAAFTNLTQDHLDFHESMAAYGAAKARLFLELSPEVSVVNVDDTPAPYEHSRL